jgi:putative peptidoglycan lipid II flippase
VLFPIVALLGISGIVVGILNTYEEFSVPALTPVFWNLAIIAGLALGVPHVDGEDARLYVYAAAILGGTLVQVLLPIPWLRGKDGHLQLVVDWRDPAVARTFKLMLPVTLGLGLINVNAVIDTLFASRLIDANLAPTAIDKAFRLYMLPQGMFSVAIATVLFPSLARLAARGDTAGFRHTVGLGIRQIAFLLIPASVVTAVLAEPITRIVYERGAWGPHETTATAGAVAAFSGGLFFNGCMLLLTRAFFSLQSNWIPTFVALGNLMLNAALDAVFYRFGIWGLPLATALVNVAGAAALFVLLRKRLGRIELGETASATVRIALASAVLAAVAFGTWYGLDEALGTSFLDQAAALAAALALGLGAYLISCRLLRVQEVKALLRLRERFRTAP